MHALRADAPARTDAQAIRRFSEFETRLPVEGKDVAGGLLRVAIERTVQKRHVTRIDSAFERLHEIVVLHAFGDVALRFGNEFHSSCGNAGGSVRAPMYAIRRRSVRAGIRGNANFVFEERVRRFARHIDAPPGNIEFPAVIDAAQPCSSLRPKNIGARRCGQNAATSPAAPAESRKAIRSSPSKRTRSGAPSVAISSERTAGSQYARSASPIGVPDPTCVTSSFSARLSIAKGLV